MRESDQGWLLASLHYLYPATVFVYFSATTAIAACTLQTSSAAAKTQHARPRTLTCLVLLFLASYVAQLACKLAEATVEEVWPPQDVIVGLLSCTLVFGIQQNRFGDGKRNVWYPLYGSWFIALVFEPIIAVLTILRQSQSALARNDRIFLGLETAIAAVRYVILFAVVLVYFVWRSKPEVCVDDDDRSPLLPKGVHADGSTDSGYGTNSESNTDATNTDATNSPSDTESPWERQEREAREQVEKRLKSEGNWISYARGFMVFFPYVWPVNNRPLQVRVALVVLCLLAGNALNVMIPRQMGILLDTLSGNSGLNPWIQVIIFAALRLASSEAGLNFVRQMLWMPVDYYSSEALTVAAYSHVMNLSADFHDSKSSSDVLVAIQNGQAISNMLESICFQALPMMIDLVVAFIYLSVIFGPYEGFITIATGLAFIQAATHMVARYKDKRRTMIKTHFEEHFIRQAGIQGWHTVSAFDRIPHEEQRHLVAARTKNASQQTLFAGYIAGHAFQYLILLCGLIAGAFLGVYQVTHGTKTAGDFAMLLAYWSQLTSPLRFFASLGKSISQDLASAERLLEVMSTKPTVAERPDAKPLCLKGDRIEFRNVSFSYDTKKSILNGVKFSVPAGKTAAFVGATGAGKSTILKLLNRFYDVTGGSIFIDGQDIRDVQLSSLRQTIGIVPQTPVLFDETIINNIRYARLTASDEEVYEACKAAAIHDHIMGFSEGYKTRVGERGIKLSGGELQRIAIARAILKSPEIVLLDEATSSVDTETEQKIQDGLSVLCKGRTTFIVAHRLSTVMNADIIFVVGNEKILEQGSHEELLEKKGKYSELWSKQIFVKPKESTPDTKEDVVGGQPQGGRKAPASEASDPCSGYPIVKPPTTKSVATRRPASTPKLITSPEAAISSQANGTVATTPKGHRKEGSRLNPGAAEFTPQPESTKRNESCLPESPVMPGRRPKSDDSALPDLLQDRALPSKADPDCEPPAHSAEVTTIMMLVDGAQAGNGSTEALPYRHFTRHDTARSASDPVPQNAPSPSTPTPSRSEISNATAAMTKQVVPGNQHTSPTKPSQASASTHNTENARPRATSRGRGRGRGARGQGRGRGGRTISTNKDANSTAKNITH